MQTYKFLAAALFAAAPLIVSAQADIPFTDAEQKYLDALVEFRQETEISPAEKHFMLAHALGNGGNLKEDRKRSDKFYALAANSGYVAAQKYLIAAHKDGSAGANLSARQLASWQANIKQKESRSNAELIANARKPERITDYLLSRTLSEPSQQEEAIGLLERSAESGYILAQLSLAYKYRRGLDGVKVSAADSKSWYLKAAGQLWPMADKGNSFAARTLADMSLNGKGLHYDPELAGVLLKVAAKQIPANDLDEDELQKIQRDLSPERLARMETVTANWHPGQALPRDMRQAICTSPDFVQPSFDRARAQAEFAEFQSRLRQSGDEVSAVQAARNGASDALDAVRKAFAQTVAPGPKGDSLLELLAQPSPRGAVSPLGNMFEMLMNKACPVGLGGQFMDDSISVELWYVDLDPEDRGALEAFKTPKLPAYGSLVRGTFPALVFSRREDGRLQLYAMSQEMAKIMNYWMNIQAM